LTYFGIPESSVSFIQNLEEFSNFLSKIGENKIKVLGFDAENQP